MFALYLQMKGRLFVGKNIYVNSITATFIQFHGFYMKVTLFNFKFNGRNFINDILP